MLTYNPETDIMADIPIDNEPYQLGIQACKEGKSVFDYPYMTSDPETEQWIDGYVSQDRKKYAN